MLDPITTAAIEKVAAIHYSGTRHTYYRAYAIGRRTGVFVIDPGGGVVSDARGGGELPGALAGPGVRVVLAGTGSHEAGSALPPVAAVAPTLCELGRVLVECCGADPAHVHTVIDP